eukprot:7300248-Pyramimonas_sp.AAC.2
MFVVPCRYLFPVRHPPPGYIRSRGGLEGVQRGSRGGLEGHPPGCIRGGDARVAGAGRSRGGGGPPLPPLDNRADE